MNAVVERIKWDLWRNPVLGREIRERARERRTIVNTTVALAVLSGIMYLTYKAITGNANAQLIDQIGIGRTLFEVVLLVLLLVVAFGAPGASADAITGERERETLAQLQVTMVTPLAIVVGKVAASMVYIVLISAMCLPLFGIAYAYGGVGIGEIIRGVIAIAFTGMLLASISVAASSMMRRTQGAVLLSYFLTLGLFAGTGIIWGFQAASASSQGNRTPAPHIFVFNPLVGVASAVDTGSFSNDGPLSSIQSFLRDTDQQPFDEDRAALGIFNGDARGISKIAFWARSLLVLSGVTALALWFASRNVATPTNRVRI